MAFTLKNCVDGRWQSPAITLDTVLQDASTGEVIGAQGESDTAQIDAALQAAVRCQQQGEWTRVPADERAQRLEAVAERLLQSADALAGADARSTGVVIGLTSKFAQVCAGAFRGAAQLLREPPATPAFDGPLGPLTIERLPLGPAAIIAPWNAPAGITAHKLASALAAGCSAVVKPSEWAPLSAQIIVEAVLEAGVPAGACQLLHGTAKTGAALCKDPRIAAVSFTGGLAGGRAVAAACAQGIKPAQLELGGNNPLVVLADANLDHAAEHIVAGLITLNGQWCRALGRLLVHNTIADELLAKVLQRLADVRMGNALDSDSQMGPLVHPGHLHHVREAVAQYQDLGGVAHQVTALPALSGWFFPPTLITGLASEQALEEIFGPVATVHEFDGDAEAVALANAAPYGLAAYVFGEEAHALTVAAGIRSGGIKINGVSLLNLHPLAPRPAWGLSGIGDEGTRETFEFFRGTRVTGVAGRNGESR